jgi:hypothetical protein
MKYRRNNNKYGRTVAQEVSRWFPTSSAWVREQVRSCGICGEQSGNGAGFFRVLRFPLPLIPTIPHPSPGAGTIGQIVVEVPSGLSLTPPPPKKQ